MGHLPSLGSSDTSLSTRSDPFPASPQLVHQNASSDPIPTSPQLVQQNKGTAIYRSHDTGFKVILDPNPSDERILKHLQEQDISNFLPYWCRKRQVTGVTIFNHRPALCFKWVSGITLMEWIQKVEVGPQLDLNVHLRVAMAIAKTLSDFHDGGVVYNRLTPENIVLTQCKGEYVATFIDLSSALIYRDNNKIDDTDTASEKQLKGVDLKSLGLVLSQVFRGEKSAAGEGAGESSKNDDGQEVNEGDPDHYKRKRGKQHTPTDGLPLYLAYLVSALLNTSTSSEICYESAKNVFLDLRIMAEDASGCLSKTKLDDLTANSRLRLQRGVFYGRQVEISMLLDLFQSDVVLGNRPLMATISGYPGTGKSTLVNQIKKPLTDLNGFFIEGMFHKHAHPDTVLASALNSFFGNFLKANTGHTLMPMKWRIHDAIGSESNNALLEILPNLKKWMAGSTNVATEKIAPSLNEKGIGSSSRLKFMFCKLIGAIPCRAHPLIIFMDDIQRADEMTLDIIRMVMTDPDICHLLFLGCYRDNEVNLSHPLTAKLNDIQEKGINIINVKIGPIEKECVNTLLSEALCMPPSLCRPLSNVVHSKAGGIILFVLRFLASLNVEGDLCFSISSRRWMYNLEDIKRKRIHDDVVSHLTEHMKSLPTKMLRGLKFASCLGPKFDANVLDKARKGNENRDSFLKSCVEFGFLQNFGSDQYVWAHNQVQQAAYDLIPLQQRESFHLLVGSRLFLSTLPSQMEHMVFVIVDNMNRGSKLLDDPDQKYEVSNLNLEAGEKSLAASSFHSAAKYLLAGLSLLGPESWEANYKLTIKLYDAASEALFVTGEFSKLSLLTEQPLLNARSFEDKLNIHNNVVRALAASSKYEEGIEKCINILSQLGEVIPTDITADVYADEVAQLKKLLHGKSRQELLSLAMMSGTRQLAAMQFMNHALTMTFIAKPLLNPIIVLRMVKMSIEHGICNISAFAFACYGAWLVSAPSCDFERGHKMGLVATEMMKRLGAVEMTTRLYATVYGFINIWKEPWQAGQDKFLEAYECGETTGDMEYATTNLCLHSTTAIYGCGENLEQLSHKIQSYAKRAFECNQRNVWISMVILHQLALDLIGLEGNSFLPFSKEMTEESCFTHCLKNNEISICRYICCKKKYGAFFRGDLDVAARMCMLSPNFATGFTGRLVSTIVGVFIDGLIGFFFARKHNKDEQEWTKIGLDAIQSLKKWVRSSDWNFSNKLHLLEAEFYFLKGDEEMAMFSYRASIKAAREHGFVHEEGLAEEKAATFLLHKSNHDDAIRHFIMAKNCYEIWGALTLVQRINKDIAMLLPLCTGK